MGDIVSKNYLRIIARLDIKNDQLIKGINLEGLRKLGDPNTFAREYYENGIDEVLYMDSVASLYGRNSLEKILERTVQNVFVPITAGGGIRSVEDARKLLSNGADKIAINSAAIKNPKLIRDLANTFGSQSVVLSIEAKSRENNWEAYINNGRERTNKNVFDWCIEGINNGAGEILITSIDKEGTFEGFDSNLIDQISKISSVPIVVSGGMGKVEHAKNILENKNLDGIAIAGFFHYKKMSVKNLKSELKKKSNRIR